MREKIGKNKFLVYTCLFFLNLFLFILFLILIFVFLFFIFLIVKGDILLSISIIVTASAILSFGFSIGITYREDLRALKQELKGGKENDKQECGRCGGSGWYYKGSWPDKFKVDCDVCGGRGSVYSSTSETCNRCDGSGWIYEGSWPDRYKVNCRVCNGTGYS